MWYEKSAQFAKKHQLLKEEKDGLLAMARVHKENQSFDEATACLEKAILILSDLKLKQNSDDEELTHLQHEIWKTDFVEQIKSKEMNRESSFQFYLLFIIAGGLLITVILLAVKLNRLKRPIN
ncbi:hypothetical protein D3C71_1033140 [compost metagenome]